MLKSKSIKLFAIALLMPGFLAPLFALNSAAAAQPTPTEQPDDAAGAELAVTDALTQVAEQKPAEFKATVEALTPYVVEEADGSISINAPADVLNKVDSETYAAIQDSINKANQIVQSNSQQLRGLPKIPWSQIYNAVKRAGKWVWYKTHLCVAAVVREWPRITSQSPNPRDWIPDAAIVCGKAMRG